MTLLPLVRHRHPLDTRDTTSRPASGATSWASPTKPVGSNRAPQSATQSAFACRLSIARRTASANSQPRAWLHTLPTAGGAAPSPPLSRSVRRTPCTRTWAAPARTVPATRAAGWARAPRYATTTAAAKTDGRRRMKRSAGPPSSRRAWRRAAVAPGTSPARMARAASRSSAGRTRAAATGRHRATPPGREPRKGVPLGFDQCGGGQWSACLQASRSLR